MHTKAKKWLIAATCFTVGVVIVTVLVGVNQKDVFYIPDNGRRHMYFGFMMQFLFLNVLPHNLVFSYYVH